MVWRNLVFQYTTPEPREIWLWPEHTVQVRESIGVGQFAGGAGAGAEKAQTGVLLASPRSTISAAYDVQTI